MGAQELIFLPLVVDGLGKGQGQGTGEKLSRSNTLEVLPFSSGTGRILEGFKTMISCGIRISPWLPS